MTQEEIDKIKELDKKYELAQQEFNKARFHLNSISVQYGNLIYLCDHKYPDNSSSLVLEEPYKILNKCTICHKLMAIPG